MTVHRTDIEKALDELISNEEGMKFQGLGVILAKLRWPEFIACERKWDRGLDAHAPATLSADGTGKGLACSLTATLKNIESDAKKSKQNFDDVKVFIFATPEPVTNHRAKDSHSKSLRLPKREVVSTYPPSPQPSPTRPACR
jgi:hypothetical protein